MYEVYEVNALTGLKDAYAKARSEGKSPQRASIEVLDREYLCACDWEDDTFVKRRISFYSGDPEFAHDALLSKDQFALKVQQELLCESNPLDYRRDMYMLYARVMNYMDGGKGGNRQNNIVNNGLIVMSDYGTDEEWEAGARKQQIELLASVKD